MELAAELREMVDEYNKCFSYTPVKDALIKQELIADTIKTLNRRSLDDTIRAFLDIPSPVGLLVKYLENPWYRYYMFEINKHTGVMELHEDLRREVRLSEIDRRAARKITNTGDWEKMLRALVDSCLLYNMGTASEVPEQERRIPADELDSRLRWDAKRADAGRQAVWAAPDKLPIYTPAAIASQFSDVVSAVFPACFTEEDSPLKINVPDSAVMAFASECKPTKPGGKLRGEDELRFFNVIRAQGFGGAVE